MTDLLKVVEEAVCTFCFGIVAVFEFGEGNVASVGDVVLVLVGNHDGLTEVVAEPLDVSELSVGHGDAGPVLAEFAAAVPGEFIEGAVRFLVAETVGEVVENDTVVFLVEAGKVGLAFYFVVILVGGEPGNVVA